MSFIDELKGLAEGAVLGAIGGIVLIVTAMVVLKVCAWAFFLIFGPL